MAKKESVPGPGQYKPVSIDPEGKYTLSTHKNSGAQNWSPAKGTRFKAQENRNLYENPPPGTYTPSDRGSAHGDYLLSNFKTLGVKRIQPKYHKGNESLYYRKLASTPGPGSYDVRSNFDNTLQRMPTIGPPSGSQTPATPQRMMSLTAGGHRPLIKRASMNVDHELSERMD